MTTFTAIIDGYTVRIGVNIGNHGGRLPDAVREEIELRTFCGRGDGTVHYCGYHYNWTVVL